MRSVIEFNKDERETFGQIISDLEGPTMMAFVLTALEDSVASGDQISDSSVSNIDVCLAALEYYRMRRIGAGE